MGHDVFDRKLPARQLFAVAVLFLVSGSACSSDVAESVLAPLEDRISTALTDAYAPAGHTLFDVSCPRSAADAETGDIFACVADVERQFVRIQVEVTGSNGSWEFTTLDLVLEMDQTELLVAAEMSDQLGDTIILDCGSPNLRVLPLGASFRCTATDSGRNDVPALLTVNGPGQTAWEIVR